MARHPRLFFDKFVKPPFEDWLTDELCNWKAKTTVANLDIMAETCFVFWKSTDASKLNNVTKARKFREFLVQSECEDFGLVWDIHDAHKHIELTVSRSGGREVNRSDQTDVMSLGWDEATWDEGRWDSPEELVVTTDSGSKRSLIAIAKNVIEMWERLLAEWGL